MPGPTSFVNLGDNHFLDLLVLLPSLNFFIPVMGERKISGWGRRVI